MATADFLKAEMRVLVYEGGKVNDPADPGGRTNQGVTQRTYTAWLASQGREFADVYKMPAVDRDAIYETEYWDKVHGDELPVGCDLVVFDAAVNSGVGQAGKWLQQALGPLYKGTHDGLIGKQTLLALKSVGDLDEFIEEYCSRRLGTLKALRTWKRFGKGWEARIANVQKIGLAWADGDHSGAPHPVIVDSLGGHQKAPVPDNVATPMLTTIQTQTVNWVKYVMAGLTLAAITAGIIVKISTNASSAAEKGWTSTPVNPDADEDLPTVTITDPPAEPIVAPAAPSVDPSLKSAASPAAIAAAIDPPVVPPSRPF
jgi:lysozyme family protein